MYIPATFEVTQIEHLCEFISEHPLAILITEAEGIPEANHIPLLIFKRDGIYFLAGHMARANAVWQTHSIEKDVLVTFLGPSLYISPTWYASKAEHHKVVPTWNYVSVHARGKIRFIQDSDWLLNHLSMMTHHMEKNLPHPWQVQDAPADFIQKLTQAIIGFEIEISEIIGKWKVSQNRSLEDRTSLIQHLVEIGETQMAELIQDSSKLMSS